MSPQDVILGWRYRPLDGTAVDVSADSISICEQNVAAVDKSLSRSKGTKRPPQAARWPSCCEPGVHQHPSRTDFPISSRHWAFRAGMLAAIMVNPASPAKTSDLKLGDA